MAWRQLASKCGHMAEKKAPKGAVSDQNPPAVTSM